MFYLEIFISSGMDSDKTWIVGPHTGHGAAEIWAEFYLPMGWDYRILPLTSPEEMLKEFADRDGKE